METEGERIDFIRKEKGLSYAELAEKIGGITGDAIRKAIQRNSIKQIYIRTISELLGVSRKWIETGEEPIYNKLEYPYVTNKPPINYGNAVLVDSPNVTVVPLVHRYAYAGYLSVWSDIKLNIESYVSSVLSELQGLETGSSW